MIGDVQMVVEGLQELKLESVNFSSRDASHLGIVVVLVEEVVDILGCDHDGANQ